MRYAQKTMVSVERSKGEIERLLIRYGADQFQSGWRENEAAIKFRISGKFVKFILPLPNKNKESYFKTPSGYDREVSPEKLAQLWEQDCRQAWRALTLIVKAKLEAVEANITTFEEEFYAHIVLPNGKTVFENTHKQVSLAYESGKMENLLAWDEKK